MSRTRRRPKSNRHERLRRTGWIAAIILPCFLVLLGAAIVWRLLAPTEDSWVRFPFLGETMMCQNPFFWLTGRCYGEGDVLAALSHASKRAADSCPGCRIAYMDVSGRHPGRLWPHLSHGMGVDVDILLVGIREEVGPHPRFPSIFRLGYGMDYEGDEGSGSIRFHSKANWRFLEGLYSNGHREVEKIFVEPYIKDWLLRAGRDASASQSVLAWADRVLAYAGDYAADHKDHFHIRFKEK
jgi:hypothetical protein